MKKYWKLLVGMVAFAAFIAAAGLAYKKLSEEYKPEENLVITDGAQDKEDTGKENQEADPETEKVPEEAVPDEERGSADEESAEALEQAPNFTVETLDEEEVSLHDFFGKPIVLNFWASWCGPCKMELPDFQEAYEKYEGEIVFLMVNMTDGAQETKKSASEYMSEAGYTLPVYYDTKQDAAYTYAVYSLPTTFFINEKGEAVAYAQGMIDAETLQTGISMILE